MEVILTFILIVMRFLDFLTTPLFKFRAKNRRRYLPPFKGDLLRISASELARKIRQKEVSSLELCEAYMRRIKDVNPVINAVVEERFKAARSEAKLVDEYLKTTSLTNKELEKIKPLLGVPLTIKECCSVKGMSLSVGLRCRAGFKAETDGECVAKLRSGGAIVLLISNTPEMALSWETFNQITGYTNNPYNTTCTSGGSSGGEGALLGSGASLIGVGSDIAGSIRLPALFNGVFGHKPTPRVISIKGHWPMGLDDKYQEFLVIGPMARYASDLKLMMKVMCTDKSYNELKLSKEVDLSKLRVYYLEEIKGSVTLPKVSQETKQVIRSSVKHLVKGCKATLMEHKFCSFSQAIRVCSSELFNIKDIPDALKWEKDFYFLELVRSLFGRSKFTLNLMYFYLMERIFKHSVGNYSSENADMRNEVVDKLGTNGVIILPTSQSPAHKHNQMYFKNFYSYLVIANSLGLPATSVPCGFDRNGMPIGVQVMAAPSQDRLCLAVAEELERFFGGWIPPPEN